jgi:mannose-6-phosphate isomerase
MAIEHAHANLLSKPWGVVDPRPWSNAGLDGITVGEIWYERSDSVAAAPSLLLKLLFTNEPLSIQVHPDDAYAKSLGLPNGKSEAWYVLSAVHEAKVALGLKRRLTSQQLRQAVDDGSIAGLVAWQTVRAGDTVFVAAGTIHAIGAGLVIAEIQQRSDATFRLFDYGRGRELHIDDAIGVADAGPAGLRVMPNRVSDPRTLLITNPYFTFERIDLAPGSAWRMEAKRETWLLAVGGSARAGSFNLVTGEAIFAQSDRVDIRAGKGGLEALVAYTGCLIPDLLESVVMEAIQ